MTDARRLERSRRHGRSRASKRPGVHRTKPPAPGACSVGAGEIWIGDVVRVWHELGAADPGERARIAEALGFQYHPPVVTPAEHDAVTRLGVRSATGTRTAASSRPVTPAPLETPHDHERGDAIALPVRLEASAPEGGPESLPAWALVSEAMPVEEPRHLEHLPRVEPLFHPGWTRAILAALCATRVAEGPIHVEHVIEALCERRPLAVLPRYPVWTLRRGVQVLVDQGEGFSFYEQDAADLVARLESIVGHDRTEVLRFVDAPASGLRGALGRAWPRWPPPQPMTPVVVLSDFGLTRGARMRGAPAIGEWERFARRVRASGCPLLGIVPFGPARWPRRLRTAIHLLRWDRLAKASLARRIASGELV